MSDQIVKKPYLFKDCIIACCSCRKMKDEIGDFVEFDFKAAIDSGIEITHTICPDCIMSLYPDIADKLKKSQP